MIYVNREVTIRDYTNDKIEFVFEIKAEGDDSKDEVS